MNAKTIAYLIICLFLSMLLAVTILSIFDRLAVIECIKQNPNAISQCKELI